MTYSSKWRAESCQLPSCCFSVFKFLPHFLYPYNGDVLNNSQCEGLNNATVKFSIHVSGMKGFFCYFPPLLSYTKQCQQESVRILFFFGYSSCVDMGVWLEGKWNTNHSRFMGRRWRWHSASTARCWCAGSRRRERKLQETEMCFELMGYIVLAQQQKVLLKNKEDVQVWLGGLLLMMLKVYLHSLVGSWLEACWWESGGLFVCVP